MKKIMYLSFAALVVLVSSCSKEPVASLSVSSEEVWVGENVSFTNTSEDFNESEWVFGDSSNATIDNPTHSFDLPGEYNVTLTAISKRGKKNTISKVIKVYELQYASIVVEDEDYGSLFPLISTSIDNSFVSEATFDQQTFEVSWITPSSITENTTDDSQTLTYIEELGLTYGDIIHVNVDKQVLDGQNFKEEAADFIVNPYKELDATSNNLTITNSDFDTGTTLTLNFTKSKK